MGSTGRLGLGISILIIGAMLIKLEDAQGLISDREGDGIFIALALSVVLIIFFG